MIINLSVIIYYYVPMVNEPIAISGNFVLENAVGTIYYKTSIYYMYLHFAFLTTSDAIMLILNCSVERI